MVQDESFGCYNPGKVKSIIRIYMKIRLLYLAIISGFVFTACATQRVSVIEGFNYDKNKNQTEYLVLPYGSALIPGRWEKTSYNSISRQQFFINQDSVKIALSFNRFDQYEFNPDGAKKGMDFVEAFYEWESEYFVNSFGLNRKLIEQDRINKFILFRIYGEVDGGNFDTYFLFSEKNGNVANMSVSITDKWTENEKIAFLKGLMNKV